VGLGHGQWSLGYPLQLFYTSMHLQRSMELIEDLAFVEISLFVFGFRLCLSDRINLKYLRVEVRATVRP
jgi:hypothetical protein